VNRTHDHVSPSNPSELRSAGSKVTPAPPSKPRRDLARVEPATPTLSTAGSQLEPEARRRALERRIEVTKERLIADITRVRSLVSQATVRARNDLGRVATRAAIAVAGLLVLGLVTALIRRRHRRIRITWR